MSATSIDMTTGSEKRHLITFALPLLLGNLLQQFYNVADTIIVGKQLGDDALAAVGATGSITFLFNTVCLGLATGSGIMIAQFFGAGFLERMKSAIWNSALITVIFGLIISIVSSLLAEKLLILMNTDALLLPISLSYMRITCGGLISVAAYNWVNAVMRAFGDSKTPLLFLCISSILNITLDLFFIMWLHTGVAGAAIATVTAQGISAISCILYACLKMPEMKLCRNDRRINLKMMALCIQNGVPIAIQSGLIAISMTALQRVTNGFGKPIMAAYTASIRVEQLIQQPFASLNAAMASFTGQNIGAGKINRAERGLRIGLRLSSAIALTMMILFWGAGGFIIRCFISGTTAVSIGTFALRVTSLCYVPLGSIYVIRGFLNGTGDTAYAMMNGMAEVICRIGGALIMTKLLNMDYHAIWYTTCITWTLTGLVGWIRYLRGKWRSKSISQNQNDAEITTSMD